MTTHRQPRSLTSKLLLAAVAAFLIIGGAILVLLLSRQSTAAGKIAALQQAGAPTNGAELNDYYRIPKGVPNSTATWLAATSMVDSQAFRQAVIALPILGRGQDVVLPGEEWEQLDESRTALNTTLAAELAAVRTAAKAGGQVRFPIDFGGGIATLLPDTQEMRSLARLLLLDAHVAAHDGESDRVVNNIHDMITTGDALAAEPCLISQLVRIAIRNIGVRAMQDLFPHCEWSDESLGKMQSHLVQGDLRGDVRHAVIGERAITISALKTMTVGPFQADNELLALEIYDEQIDAFDKPWFETLEKNSELDERLRKLLIGKIAQLRYNGVATLAPAFTQVSQAAARSDAQRRSAVLALAAYRHKLKHGTFPEGVRDIEPEFLPDESARMNLRTDPFTGKPLILKRIDDGIVVYSVGEDRNDDGGQVPHSANDRLPDVGFRLLTPKQ